MSGVPWDGEIVSKAEAARRAGVSIPTIRKYIAAGVASTRHALALKAELRQKMLDSAKAARRVCAQRREAAALLPAPRSAPEEPPPVLTRKTAAQDLIRWHLNRKGKTLSWMFKEVFSGSPAYSKSVYYSRPPSGRNIDKICRALGIRGEERRRLHVLAARQVGYDV